MKKDKTRDQITHPNPHAKSVKLRCFDIEMSEEVFKDELSGIPWEIFNKKGHFYSEEEHQIPFKLQTVALIHLACGIHPEKFLIKNKAKEKGYRSHEHKGRTKYFTRDYWEKLEPFYRKANSLIEYIRYEQYGLTRNTELDNAYKKVANDYLSAAESSIEVFEVLFKDGQLKAYTEAQHHIHTAIQKWLDENKKHNRNNPNDQKKYHYMRTLSVSQSTVLLAKREMDEVLRAMIAEATSETLAHILWVMKNHDGHCTFKVAKASWYRNQVLIDEKIAIIEDYTIIKNKVLPDGMFINDVTEHSNARELITAIRMQSDERMNPERTEDLLIIKEQDVVKGIIDLAKHVAGQIAKREKAIELINASFPDHDDLPHLSDLLKREGKALKALEKLKTDISIKVDYLDNSELGFNLELEKKVEVAIYKAEAKHKDRNQNRPSDVL